MPPAAAVASPDLSGADQPNTAVSLRGLRKTFGDVVAVDDVDLDIFDGEFLTLLGPSGSGKTTVLRMIAGFELPTAGTILLSGEDVSQKAPFDRDVNTVFQDYALFPHMTVLQNVEYGLRVKKVPKAERRQRAQEALDNVRLADYGKRKPSQLSGGQRQRVALARALVNRPRVLLLDEPLGALDLKLRQEMQVELKELQRDVGVTFIFVTHDQEEALTMSDRIAVFDTGRIRQLGSPAEIYERPASSFVAGFVGTSNLLTATAATQIIGQEGTFSIRPEKVRIAAVEEEPTAAEHSAMGSVHDVEYVGAFTRFIVNLEAGGRLVAVQQNLESSSSDVSGYRNTRVRLIWNRKHEFRVADAT